MDLIETSTTQDLKNENAKTTLSYKSSTIESNIEKELLIFYQH